MLADVNSVSIFALLPINSIFVSCSLYDFEAVIIFIYFYDTIFTLQEKIHVLNCFFFFSFIIKATIDFSIWIFVFNVSAVLSSLTWPFLICFFATMATNCVASIGINAYGLNWYDFPAKLQKYIILIMLRSQHPPYFSGLNFIFCTIENFGNVSNFS